MLPYLLLLEGQLADALTTAYGMQHGLVELNPLINAYGLWPMKALSTVAACGLLYGTSPKYQMNAAIGFAAILNAAALWNLYHIVNR